MGPAEDICSGTRQGDASTSATGDAGETRNQHLAQMVRFLNALLDPEQIVELRGLGVRAPARDEGRPVQGYFDADHRRKLAEAAYDLSTKRNATGVYFGLNVPRPDLLSNAPNHLRIARRGCATADHHIIRRCHLPIDVDPVRTLKTASSTDAEKAEARKVIDRLRGHLRDLGWSEGVLCDSSNGYHLLFLIDLPTDDRGLVKNTLEALAAKFNSPLAKIDVANHNPSRIWKLPGTWGRKGVNTPERPHRLAQLLDLPEKLVPVPRGKMEELVAEIGRTGAFHKTAAQSISNNSNNGQHCLKVEQFLTARGISYGRKKTGGPSTIWIIDRCPFDSTHGDHGEVCVGQRDNGATWFKCHHNSCAERKWREFCNAVGRPGSDEYDPPLQSSGKPGPDAPRKDADYGNQDQPAVKSLLRIDAGTGDLAGITEKAWNAIQLENDPPTLFRYGALPSRIESDDDGKPLLRGMTQDRMRHRLARIADWHKISKGREISIYPPIAVVKDVLASPDPPLPVLTRIVGCPIFAADGTLQIAPGYSAAGQTFFVPAHGFTVPGVSVQPSAVEIHRARELLYELIGEFPFVGETDMAHAFCAMLLPFVRQLIPGPTPLHNFEAPGPGTGKTLLVQAAMLPALGGPATAMTEGSNEEEWRKRLLAKLMGAPSLVFIDNARRRVDSAALASALTAYPLWEDRLLGKSEIIRVPVWCAWVLTGNNPAFSSEMTRRTIRSRLDAKMDQPWLHRRFRHSALLEWAKAHRGDLVWGALTLIQAWLSAGRPPGRRSLGMFEEWARTMGGILEVAGIRGFLENLQEFYETADTEGAAWRTFVAAWWIAYEERGVKVGDLYSLAVEAGLSLGEKSEQSQKVRLGIKLSEARDRVFSIDLPEEGLLNLRIEHAGEHRRAVLWRLRKCESVSVCESPDHSRC